MAIVRWDPFRELTRELARDFMDPWFLSWPRLGSTLEWAAEWPARSWVPPVDIYETKDGALVVKAELPGLKREDIDVTVEDNILTIRGERRSEHEDRAGRVHRRERSYGEFSRSFTLPADIDAEQIRAEYRDGTLTVTLPRKPEARPRQIPVEVAA
jgi:HSP20 family protein